MRESDALNLGQCGRLMVCVATLDSLGKSSDSDHRSFYAAFAEQSRMSTAETQLPICSNCREKTICTKKLPKSGTITGENENNLDRKRTVKNALAPIDFVI
jgi:hypothetical protein